MRWIKYIAVITFIMGVGTFAGCGKTNQNSPFGRKNKGVGTLAGCGKKAVDKIGFGTLENQTYRNEFFGMSVKLPHDWHALDDETRKKMMQVSKKMIAGQDKNLQAALDAGELTTVTLFTVQKHPLGAPVPFNPSLACVAEKVGHLPGIKKGSDYLYHMKKLMKMSQLKYVFTKDIYSKKIGGINFDVQDAEINIGTLKVKQKYYAAIMRGYALSFVISSTTKEEEESLKRILASVGFHKS